MVIRRIKSSCLRRGWAVLVFICAVAAMFGNGSAAWAVKSGSIVAWGLNYCGQCNVPSPNSGFVEVAAGAAHSLGLKEDGSIVAWGNNHYGQRNVPSSNSGFVAIAAGGLHSLGLKGDGSIIAWGWNNSGQCNVPSPNSGFVAVAAGMYHSLGLKGDGSIVAWGYNGVGECNVPSPNSGFVAVAAGMFHSLGLKGDGSIVAWGYNGVGECNVPSPNSGFVAIAAGGSHNLGLKTDGSIVAWGRNDDGECNVPSPNSGFVAVAAGYGHSLGLKGDGSMVAWGLNDYGQCNVPSPNSDFVAVAAGEEHSLGIRESGALPTPTPTPKFFSISGKVTYNGSGLLGVVMNGLPNNPQTDSNGNYSDQVSSDWSGTVIPSKANYTFNPPSITYNYVTSNQTNQDYIATYNPQYTISGKITYNGSGLSGVVMSGLPNYPRTDMNGNYSNQVISGWSGAITPNKTNYAFYPISRPYNNVTSNQTNQDYIATYNQHQYTISGQVTYKGFGLSGVVMSGLPNNPRTDTNGNYSNQVISGWSGIVTPSITDYAFYPTSLSYNNITSNQTNQDYTAVNNPTQYTISGQVIYNGSGLSDVVMNGLPNNPQTDANGNYSDQVNSGWSITVTPTKANYTFNPIRRSYSHVISDKINQDYTATYNLPPTKFIIAQGDSNINNYNAYAGFSGFGEYCFWRQPFGTGGSEGITVAPGDLGEIVVSQRELGQNWYRILRVSDGQGIKWGQAFNVTDGDVSGVRVRTADLDNDGEKEIFCGSIGRLNMVACYKKTGTFVGVWGMFGQGDGTDFDFDVGDIDNDGNLEIVAGKGPGAPASNNCGVNDFAIYKLEQSGGLYYQQLQQYRKAFEINEGSGIYVAVGDVIPEVWGKEIICCQRDPNLKGGCHNWYKVFNYDGSKLLFWGQAFAEGDCKGMTVSCADWDNDGRDEIIFGQGKYGSNLYAIVQINWDQNTQKGTAFYEYVGQAFNPDDCSSIYPIVLP